MNCSLDTIDVYVNDLLPSRSRQLNARIFFSSFHNVLFFSRARSKSSLFLDQTSLFRIIKAAIVKEVRPIFLRGILGSFRNFLVE